ncbi:MAG: hypothetical protein O7F71_13365, partial [Gammaproteobacteria bacterium]|nr:hypothetical protein [Gammaproteobacteria bacterium]
MTFLEEFDKLDVWDANALLYNRIIHDYDALFAELREHRPVLKFWSHHPGNADLKEKGPGYAYLLSRADQVQHALQNFCMQPYNAIPQSPFVLTIDNVAQHDKVRASMTRALALDEPQQISDLIQEAVDLEWRDVSGRLPIIDIRAFVRNAALRFTGSYFGIPEEYIFSPVPVPPQLKASVSGFESLKQWSGEGYENFIWKIHARHFGSPEPQMQNALQKIYFLIGKMMAESPLPNTVIGRFMLEREHFPSNHHIIVNIIGMIQGLVDNVMTGACYALNQFIAQGQVDQVRDLTVSQLIDAIRKIHKRDTPSPFLPRRGALNAFDGFTSANPETNFACAIGSALNDPNHDSGDIRLGYGMHECIGRDIGDEIKARSLAVILKLGNLKITEPLEKQWGWIVRRFEVAGEQLDEHENGRIVRNRNAINRAAFATTPRPRPYGLWSGSADVVSDYTSWPALSDRTFFSRHLPPATAEYSNALPNNTAPESKSYGDVTELFRRQGEQTGSRSSLLFAFFAQWFTDSFLRTEPDRRKTSSNHQIDMCQIYGLKEATTNILRAGSAGKLKTEPTLTDGEYLPYLFDSSGRVKPEFRGLPYVEDGRYRTILEKIPDAETKKETYFATGLERGNSTCGYAALSTLFLREHNRICDSLRQKNPKWGDERLFQTA